MFIIRVLPLFDYGMYRHFLMSCFQRYKLAYKVIAQQSQLACSQHQTVFAHYNLHQRMPPSQSMKRPLQTVHVPCH
jgi:hypothetical protein